jgi:NitT/TauT family transport system substrate-binding protein
MKKVISLLLLFTLILSLLISCNNVNDDETVIKIGYMQGPTGMGMAKLIHDNGGVNGNEKYAFTKFEDVQAATAAILSGAIDLACLPTNNASIIYNTKDAAVKVLAINCLNSLFVLTKSGTEISGLEDLDGKVIYTISNGTPKVILEYLINAAEINAEVKTEAIINGETKKLAQPSDLASAIIAGAVDIALVPEPVATAAPLQVVSQKKDYTYTTAFSLDDAWSKTSDTPVAMGCIVARADFVENHKGLVNSFLDEYKASIEFISNKDNIDTAAEYIVEASVLGAVPAAKKSLLNLGSSIAYIDGDDMKRTLTVFYNSITPALIGGKLPDDGFYYEK